MSFFSSAQSYTQDPNEAVKSGSTFNYIYARCKNTSSEQTAKPVYIHTYMAGSSLFLDPAKWKQTKLLTNSGKSFVETKPIGPGEIGVGKEIFLLDAKQRHTCLIGYATTEQTEPNIPQEMSNYENYVVWIRNNTNICMRNLTVISTPLTDYEVVDEFSNPNSDAKPFLLLVTLEKATFPIGTKIVVDCKTLGIDASFTYDGTTTMFTMSNIVPAWYNGIIRTSLFLPRGTVWPVGGKVGLSMSILVPKNSIAREYAFAPDRLNLNGISDKAQNRLEPGLLLTVGMCSTVYQRP